MNLTIKIQTAISEKLKKNGFMLYSRSRSQLKSKLKRRRSVHLILLSKVTPIKRFPYFALLLKHLIRGYSNALETLHQLNS